MRVLPLLELLADGSTHHVTELAQIIHCTPQQLNAIWQTIPLHIRSLLRQLDGGFWRLVRPIALLPKNIEHDLFKLTVFDEVGSTNDVLLSGIRAGEDLHRQAVVAHQQTRGRGRQEKIWQACLGESLLLSCAWRFSTAQSALGALAPLTALACQRALASYGCVIQIKWPNDLVLGLAKLGGILIETVRRNGMTYAVVGVGINFMSIEPSENKTAFQAISHQKTSIKQLVDEILNNINLLYQDFEHRGFLPFLSDYESVHRDQCQEIYLLQNDKMFTSGRVLGISEQGALRLMTREGERQIVNGEISLRRPEQILLPEVTCNTPHYLLLDAGNSRLKWAWVQNGQILQKGQASYRDLSRLQRDWVQYHQPHTEIYGSAVCGAIKKSLIEQNLPTHSVKWLSSMARAMGIVNHYRTPEMHGADRWFNALGSRKFTQNACVIVSCGTAVTIDALTDENHYLGGSILPGFHLMRESLAQSTAQLNKNEGLYYPFPTTTNNAITTGMVDAVCGAIMLMHARLKSRYPKRPVDVILTGGGAHKIIQYLPDNFTLENTVKIVDNLVILGLLNWIEHQ